MCRIVPKLVGSPAAGADWSFTPSTTDGVKLLTVTAKLTTSATAADRFPALVLKNQEGDEFYSADFAVAQPASLAVTYTWARDVSGWWSGSLVTGQRVSGPVPCERLRAGDTVSVSTLNIDAADQWSDIACRFLTSDRWEDLQELEQIRALLA